MWILLYSVFAFGGSLDFIFWGGIDSGETWMQKPMFGPLAAGGLRRAQLLAEEDRAALGWLYNSLYIL